jgi:hypothetical protein
MKSTDNQLNCRIRPIIIPEHDSPDRKEFCRWRAKMYVIRYARDIESIAGLCILMESFRLPEKEQIKDLRKLREGDYPLNNGKIKNKTKLWKSLKK